STCVLYAVAYVFSLIGWMRLLCRQLVPFFLDGPASHRDLRSFPTRRSSDLMAPTATGRKRHPGYGDAPLRGASCVTITTWQLSRDRKSTRLNSSHVSISYAVFCLKKKKTKDEQST